MNWKKNIILIICLIIILLMGIYSLVKTPVLYSYFENRELEEKPRFYLVDYLSEKYQNSLEKSLSDQFIGSQIIKINYKKYTSFLDLFHISNLICKNNYLAYDENNYTYNCKNKLLKKPIKKEQISYYLKKNSKMYNYINKKYDVYYYFVNDSVEYDFKKNKKSFSFKKIAEEYFIGNYHVEESKLNSFEDYNKYFYNSDHHWNYYGSYESYKRIIKMIYPKDSIIKSKGKFEAKDYKFFGSSAKQVRKLNCYDKFISYIFDIKNYTSIINRQTKEYGNYKEILSSKNYLYIPYDNIYATYFGTDYGEIIFDFDNQEKENLLIISNSFSNPIDLLIASHFNKTYVVDLRHYKNSLGIDFEIDKYMKENNINKILILGNHSYFDEEEFNFKVGDDSAI